MFNKIWLITLNTFRETVRDRLLYSLIIFALLSIAASYLAGTVSLGQDVRVIEDFSLTAMFVFLLIITIFIGTQLVYREIERRTIYLILPKPISREAFYLGKFFGLCLTITVAGLIMGVLILSLVYYKGHFVPTSAIWAVIFTILEMWLLTALGLLFSSFTAPIASAIYTFSLVLIGHSGNSIMFIAQKNNVVLKYILEFVYYVFPNLEKFNLRNEVAFNIHLAPTQYLTSLGYFLVYTLALLFFGLAIFRRNEF